MYNSTFLCYPYGAIPVPCSVLESCVVFTCYSHVHKPSSWGESLLIVVSRCFAAKSNVDHHQSGPELHWQQQHQPPPASRTVWHPPARWQGCRQRQVSVFCSVVVVVVVVVCVCVCVRACVRAYVCVIVSVSVGRVGILCVCTTCIQVCTCNS